MMPGEKRSALNQYKAKLVRFQANKPGRAYLDLAPHEKLNAEAHSLYQIIRTKRRQETQDVLRVKDDHRAVLDSPHAVHAAFLWDIGKQYEPKDMNETATRKLLEVMEPVPTTIHADLLERPVTGEE
jgi:hypothetical protein